MTTSYRNDQEPSRAAAGLREFNLSNRRRSSIERSLAGPFLNSCTFRVVLSGGRAGQPTASKSSIDLFLPTKSDSREPSAFEQVGDVFAQFRRELAKVDLLQL
jgi:hypothetical protein